MTGQSVIVAIRATMGRSSFSTTGRARMLFNVSRSIMLAFPRRLSSIIPAA
jgi:hypothetical protein